MQNKTDMDLEYQKPLNEYVLPREHIECHYASAKKETASSSKLIKKIMMFATASVLIINTALGVYSTPQEVRVESSFNKEASLAMLTPYMEQLYPLIQQRDAMAIMKYLNKIRPEILEMKLEPDDECYSNGLFWGVYNAEDNKCIANTSEMTSEQGFAFIIWLFDDVITMELCCGNVINGMYDGNVYYFMDRLTSFSSIERDYKEGYVEKWIGYVWNQDHYEECVDTKITIMNSEEKSRHIIVYNNELSSERVEYDVDTNGQLIIHEWEEVNSEYINSYLSDSETDWDSKYKYTLYKDFVLINNESKSFGSSFRIKNPPLGLEYCDSELFTYELFKHYVFTTNK